MSYATIAWLDIGIAALAAVAGLPSLLASRRPGTRSPDPRSGRNRNLRVSLTFLFVGISFLGQSDRNVAVQWAALAAACMVMLVTAAAWLQTHHRSKGGTADRSQ